MKRTAMKMGVSLAALVVAALMMSVTPAAAEGIQIPLNHNHRGATATESDNLTGRPIYEPTRKLTTRIEFYNYGGKGPYPQNH
jgi:hypothetical protein